MADQRKLEEKLAEHIDAVLNIHRITEEMQKYSDCKGEPKQLFRKKVEKALHSVLQKRKDNPCALCGHCNNELNSSSAARQTYDQRDKRKFEGGSYADRKRPKLQETKEPKQSPVRKPDTNWLTRQVDAGYQRLPHNPPGFSASKDNLSPKPLHPQPSLPIENADIPIVIDLSCEGGCVETTSLNHSVSDVPPAADVAPLSLGNHAPGCGSDALECLVNGSTVEKLMTQIESLTQRIVKAELKLSHMKEAEKANNKTPIAKSKRKGAGASDQFEDLPIRRTFSAFTPKESEIGLQDLAALDDILPRRLRTEIFGKRNPKGITVTGPGGCGKTMLAKAVIGKLGMHFISVDGLEIASSRNTEMIEDLVQQIVSAAPCAVLIEDVMYNDNTETSRMNKQISVLLSALCREVKDNGQEIWIIATSSTTIDKKLLDKQVFQVKINIDLPKESMRSVIWDHMIKRCGIKLEPDFDLKKLAKNTPAYSPDDFGELMKETLSSALMRLQDRRRTELGVRTEDLSIDQELEDFPSDDEVVLTMADFENSLEKVVPLARHSGNFVESSETTWADVGGMEDVRKILELKFLEPINNPVMYRKIGRHAQISGVLLYGPPGCGKTLIAKAIANEASLNFMAINGPELFRKYVGESEKMVREAFERAKRCAPCLIFLDEIDSLCEKRTDEGGAKVNVVNQFLTMLQGVHSRGQVFVMGATNRLDRIDPAFIRPGRFDICIKVSVPDARQRYKILSAQTRGGTDPLLAEDIDLEEVANDRRLEAFTGAELQQVVTTAGTFRYNKVKDGQTNGEFVISKEDFETAIEFTSMRKRGLEEDIIGKS